MNVGDQVYIVERRGRDGKVINDMEVMLRTELGGKKIIGMVTGPHPLMKQMVMVQWSGEDAPVPAFRDELRVTSAIDLLGDLVDEG